MYSFLTSVTSTVSNMWYDCLKKNYIYCNRKRALNLKMLLVKCLDKIYSWVPVRRPAPLINFSIFFHPGNSYSNSPPPNSRMLIIGESFQPRQIFETIYSCWFFCDLAKERPICSVFYFVSSCKESNTLCFVL